MSFFKNLIEKSRKSLKFSASDPSTFVEVWSFTSSRIRVISLLILVLLIFGIGVLFVFGGVFGDYSGKNDVSIERKKLENQREQIEELTVKLNEQEQYISAVRKILRGEVPIESDLDSLQTNIKQDNLKLNDKPSSEEKQLAKKVKDDMRTVRDGVSIPYFRNPVKGVLSQEYDRKTHPAVDIVTEKDHTVKACYSGTVVYSGYTRMDGYILILDHANGYITVYKHNKKALKKIGEKVKLGDPIAIVGNTGDNTDGPHLHFELWYNQSPVNPTDYMNFKN
jgi:murein DD-endopeptidase MepM/ murein hydrolase activator NlpD